MRQLKSKIDVNMFPASADGAVRFLQFTDLHLHDNASETLLGLNTDYSLAAVIQLAKQAHLPPDFVLVTGDMVHSGSVKGYNKLYQELNGFHMPVYCLSGNHDNPSNMRQVLNQGYVSTPRRVKIGKWNIVLLESTILGKEAGRLEKRELDYLQSCLQQDPTAYYLIALHHPPHHVGSPWLDSMTLENPDELFETLNQFPTVRCVLSGHVHQSFEGQRDGISLMTSPSTCIQFKPNCSEFSVDTRRTPGYRWLQLNADGTIETEVKRLDQLPADIDIAASGYL